MKNSTNKDRPTVPYWEDRVYHYVSRQHRSAVDARVVEETTRLDGLMQELVNGTMPDKRYWELDAEAREDKKERKRNKHSKTPPHASGNEPGPSLNIADLKKRIYNMQVSRENMIKALEALPAQERKATIAGLPPGLRRKLGKYPSS